MKLKTDNITKFNSTIKSKIYPIFGTLIILQAVSILACRVVLNTNNTLQKSITSKIEKGIQNIPASKDFSYSGIELRWGNFSPVVLLKDLKLHNIKNSIDDKMYDAQIIAKALEIEISVIQSLWNKKPILSKIMINEPRVQLAFEYNNTNNSNNISNKINQKSSKQTQGNDSALGYEFNSLKQFQSQIPKMISQMIKENHAFIKPINDVTGLWSITEGKILVGDDIQLNHINAAFKLDKNRIQSSVTGEVSFASLQDLPYDIKIDTFKNGNIKAYLAFNDLHKQPIMHNKPKKSSDLAFNSTQFWVSIKDEKFDSFALNVNGFKGNDPKTEQWVGFTSLITQLDATEYAIKSNLQQKYQGTTVSANFAGVISPHSFTGRLANLPLRTVHTILSAVGSSLEYQSIFEKFNINSALVSNYINRASSLNGVVSNAWFNIKDNQVLNIRLIVDKLDFETKIGQERIEAITGKTVVDEIKVTDGALDVKFDGKQGKAALHIGHIQYFYDNRSKSPLILENISTKWSTDLQDIQLNTNKDDFKNANQFATANRVIRLEELKGLINKVYLGAKGQIVLDAQKNFPAELSLQTSALSVSDIVSALPKTYLPDEGYAWLTSALSTGKIPYVNLVLRGDLSQFPYHIQGKNRPEPTGVFEIYAPLVDVDLKYEPMWPSLDKIQGELLFSGRSLSIDIFSAQITGVPVQWAKGYIGDLSLDEPNLIVDSSVVSTLEQGREFVYQSPLKEKLEHVFNNVLPKGPMDLRLMLFVPLGNKIPIDVDGSILTQNASVTIDAFDIHAQSLSGQITFTQDSTSAENLHARLFDENAVLSLHSFDKGNDAYLKVIAQSSMKMPKLENYAKLPSLRGFVDGRFSYDIELDFPIQNDDAPTLLTLFSDFKGVKIDAPFPFGKKSEETNPSELILNFENKKISVNAHYDKFSQVMFQIKQDNGKWTMPGAYIHFGKPMKAIYLKNNTLKVDGVVPEFHVGQWQDFGDKITKRFGDVQKPDVEYKPVIDLKVALLNAMGFILRDADFRVNVLDKIVKVQLSGSSIEGIVNVPLDERLPIDVNLKHIKIEMDDKEKLLVDSKTLRPLNLVVDKLYVNDKIFTKIKTNLIPKGDVYDMQPLHISTPGMDFVGKASWGIKAINPSFGVDGVSTIYNLGDMIGALGLDNTFKGSGTVDASVNWKGSPSEPQLESISGQLDIKMNKGQLTSVNAKIGKMASLLNVNSIQRRLKLDFSDLLGKGFHFDNIIGLLKIEDGLATIETMEIKSPTADISAKGQTNLNTKALDLSLNVVPHISGAVPVATAVATGNPMLGAGVWVVDKLFGSPIGTLIKLKYHIQGTWSDPKVVDKSTEKVKK